MLERFLKRKTPQLIDRDGQRYDISLRVMSRDLPGYRGVTHDLSRSGVQLETTGLLKEGAEMDLTFEFDRGELESFECPARVVWSRDSGASDRKFLSGLTFVPKTDDQKRQLSRMATVIQARSETDLETLLDQARRLDPELERTYQNLTTNQTHLYAQGAPPPPPPSQVTKEKARKEVPPRLGIFIPLAVELEGYTWNRSEKTLHLGLREGEVVHNLYFPGCLLFQVLQPPADREIGGLYSAPSSPATRKLELANEQAVYKHYRFVDAQSNGLLDIVSQPCATRPKGP